MNFDAKVPRKLVHWYNDRLHFFKYMSEGTAKIVLENQTLRWSTAQKLNDPFDLQFDMKITDDEATVKREIANRMWEQYENGFLDNSSNPFVSILAGVRATIGEIPKSVFMNILTTALDDAFRQWNKALPGSNLEVAQNIATFKILSLTTRPNIPTMWSHYANSHQGVAMRFRSIPEQDSQFGMARPMQYLNNVPSQFSEEDMIRGFLEPTSEMWDLQTKIMDKIVYTKSKDWEYEQEWRIYGGHGVDMAAEFEDLPFNRDELDGVIFGLKTTDSDKEDMMRLAAKYPNARFFQVNRNRSAFDLSITAV